LLTLFNNCKIVFASLNTGIIIEIDLFIIIKISENITKYYAFYL